MSAPKVNATATRDTTCTRCGASIANGARCAVFRERALSYRAAAHAGTMYPKKRWCVDCATTPEIFRGGAVSTPKVTPETLRPADISRLTSLGTPLSMRRDAAIAMNLNGIYSERRVRNARQRICDAINAKKGRTDGVAW